MALQQAEAAGDYAREAERLMHEQVAERVPRQPEHRVLVRVVALVAADHGDGLVLPRARCQQ